MQKTTCHEAGGVPPCFRKMLLVMKLSLIFLVLALQVSAKNYGQKMLNLDENNITLTDVFKKIENKYAFKFYFSNDIVPEKHFTTIRAKSASIDEVMNKVLEGSGLYWKMLSGDRIVVGNNFNQQNLTITKRIVTGTVKDNTGQPLANVSVIVKGTVNGVTTSNDGRFSINAANGDTLVFSSVGYQPQEVVLAAEETIDITLQPSLNNLDEIVVVGYGTQKQVNLTGAVTQVSGKVLEDRPITRISQALQGQVAGLNITTNYAGGAPDAKQTINVRGYTGLGATGAPLIVIDGVQGGDINSLNPRDVESITVLKDAASTAIYGSSAPYGVLLITTKKGKAGKPRFSYDNNFSWAQPINLPKMMNSLDFANLYNEAFENAGRPDFFTAETIKRIQDYQAGKLTTQTIANPTPGSNSWYNWDAGNANNDWFKIYFKKFAFSQQHNISVSGGSANSNYYVSIGYNDRAGMYNYGNDDFKRYNVKANLSTNVTPWLTFSLRTTLSRSLNNTPNTYNNQTGGNYMHQIARKFPTVSLINPDGNYSDESNVPLQLYGGRTKYTEDQPLLTGEVVIKPLKGWNITANYTFDGDFIDRTDNVKTVYVYRPDGTNYPSSGTSPNSFSRSNSRNQHYVFNLFSSYQKTYKKHDFSILGGFVSELTDYASYGAGNSLLYSNDIPSLNLTYGTSPSIGDSRRQLAVEGYFGRLNYSFAGKYLLEVNGRYDATSRFLDNRRWKFSPGVSAGWNVDKEIFWQPLKTVVNTFKIRGSYGSSPDQLFLDPSSGPTIGSWYPFYPSLGTSTPTNTGWLFGGSQQAATTMPPLVNPDLTWVTTTSYGIGTDITMLNNRLSTSFDWYIRKSDNFVGPAAVLPSLLGTSVPQINNAGTQTKGFELTLKWQDNIGDLSYSVRGSLADYQGKVVRYNNPTKSLSTWYVGESMGEIWGYQTSGLYQTQAQAATAPTASFWQDAFNAGDVIYRDLNGDKIINNGQNTVDSSGDLRVIGNNTPRYQYSFDFNFGYKGFDLDIFLQGISKRDSWVGSNYFWGIVGDEWQSSPFTTNLDRWSPQNPNGYFPKFYMSSENGKNTQVTDRYLQNAAYLRIKSVQLGYSLPENIAKRIAAQRVRLYFTVDNLATFTKLISTMDPELSINDAKIYPLQRTFSFGANVSF